MHTQASLLPAFCVYLIYTNQKDCDCTSPIRVSSIRRRICERRVATADPQQHKLAGASSAFAASGIRPQCVAVDHERHLLGGEISCNAS